MARRDPLFLCAGSAQRDSSAPGRAGQLGQFPLASKAEHFASGKSGHRQDAVSLARTALRLSYTRPILRDILASHYNLATYLFRSRTDPGEQRAHRLTAALLEHLLGDTHARTQTLHVLSTELRGDTDRLEAPPSPTTLSEVIRLVDAGEGVHFGQLVASLCPDPDAADHALAELLTTAATLPEQPAENTIRGHLTEWEPW